ncbi:RNase adapter RapZ [Corynebacterium otitidis]
MESASRGGTGRLIAPPILITGMSGSGLSTAGKVFEDNGWYVAHNLPPELIVELAEMCAADDSPVDRVGMVMDVRSRMFRGSILQTFDELRSRGLAPIVLFLDAREDVLIKRFDSVKRTHPLQGGDSLSTGIARERETLSEIKEDADVVIDSSDMSIHDLRRRIEETFGRVVDRLPHVTVQSFGFKNGAPRDSDLTLDVRFLPNPYWEPELREFRGTDKPVADFVLDRPAAQGFIERFLDLFSGMQEGYRHEGKNFVTVSIGCTGGHHRSVAVAEEIGRRLSEAGDLDITVTHRDLATA